MSKQKQQLKEWCTVRLGDLVDIKGGKRLPKGNFVLDKRTSHPYLRVVDMKFDGLNISNIKYITDDVYNKISKYTISDKDVYISIAGTIGLVGKVPSFLSGANLTENCAKLCNFSKNLDQDFLIYFLRSPFGQSQITSKKAGTSQPKLALYRIAEIKINLPSLPTQQKIASVLSAYDELIENNTKRIKVLEELAQAVYNEWFVKFRFLGYEKVKMIDSGTEFGKIPEGWEVRKVSEMIKRISSGKKYNNKTVKKIGTVPVLDQGRSGIIGYHDDEPGIIASEENPVIVFANHTCYQRLIQYPFSTIQNVLPFYPSNENYRNIYWLHWATKDIIKFNDYKGHWPEFIGKEILVPTPDLCDKFGEFAKVIVRQVYKSEQINQNLRQTRDSLLPKLVSGEVEI